MLIYLLTKSANVGVDEIGNVSNIVGTDKHASSVSEITPSDGVSHEDATSNENHSQCIDDHPLLWETAIFITERISWVRNKQENERAE